jgi:MOSC domain-containing protein YiiM
VGLLPPVPCPLPVEVVALVVSAVHRCEGRPRDGITARPAGAPPESRATVRVEAGRGIVGDRYAGRPAHRAAAVRLIGLEDLEAVADELGVPRFDPALARRNVVLRGVDVGSLRGREVGIDCGDGVVRLLARRAANPCAWMDVLLAPGAHRALRGRGGLRCEPLGSGVLRVGPAWLVVGPPTPGAAGPGAGPPPRC